MNKIEKVTLDAINKMEGCILGFGNFSDNITSKINKLDKIYEFLILDNGEMKSQQGEGGSKKKNKYISYKKIKKKFKKKNIDYIIANYEELGKYHRRFISDSLFLTNKSIYVIIKSEDTDVELIKRRYGRYKETCEIIECRDGFVLHIEKNKYKSNILRDKIYLIIDTIIDGIIFFGDVFVS